MKTLIAVATGAALLVMPFAFAHDNHDHATGVVKERMEVMTSVGKRMLAISKRLRENRDFAGIAKDAAVIRDSAVGLLAKFPPGSLDKPTAAKDAIWKDWPDFTAKVKALETEAARMMAADIKNGEALRAQFRALAKACDGCHESYRVPQQK